MTTTELISVAVAIASMILAAAGWLRNTKGDSASDAEWRGQISAKLDSIMANVAGLGRDIERLDGRVNILSERVAKVEASAESAHNRLDQITGKGGVKIGP